MQRQCVPPMWDHPEYASKFSAGTQAHEKTTQRGSDLCVAEKRWKNHLLSMLRTRFSPMTARPMSPISADILALVWGSLLSRRSRLDHRTRKKQVKCGQKLDEDAFRLFVVCWHCELRFWGLGSLILLLVSPAPSHCYEALVPFISISRRNFLNNVGRPLFDQERVLPWKLSGRDQRGTVIRSRAFHGSGREG
jgi:hypothetical protein